ncbi:hypothetical protein RUND412_005146 [Rhizina undulata]
MTNSTSRYKSTPRKSTLDRRERPLPKPKQPKRQVPEVKVKMKFEIEDSLDMQGLSEQKMATSEDLDRIIDSIKNEDFDASGSSNSSSQQPQLKSPALSAPAHLISTSEGANTDAVHRESQAPSDTINSSAPAMLSGNFMGSGQYMVMSGLEKGTAEAESPFENFRGGEIEVGAENEVPGCRKTSSEHQRRSPEQEQEETSVNVSELFSTARPLSTVMGELLNAIHHLQNQASHLRRVSGAAEKLALLEKGEELRQKTYREKIADLDRKILDADNLAAELKRKKVAINKIKIKCSNALDEIVVFRENEQRTAVKAERLEAASGKRARELEALHRQLELRDAELSEAKERWSNFNETLQQERALMDARESEIIQRQKECWEKEIHLESHAQVTAYREETDSNPRFIVFQLTHGKNATDRFYKYIEEIEINIEQLVCESNSSVEIYFATAHATMTFMTQRASYSDPNKPYDGYSPVRINIEDGFITASWINQTNPIPRDTASRIVKDGASRVVIVENLSPDTTKAQLRSDFFLDKSLLKTDIKKWNEVTVGRLHYASISDAVGVKMNLENGQNTSGKRIRTYIGCTVRFGRGPGNLY